MLALVIDTSSAAVTAGVVDVSEAAEVTVLAERVTVDARAHGELLTPSLQSALAEAQVTIADLAGVLVGLGPGPFTGLRIGLVTAASIADATGLPAYGACSLDAIGALHADEPDLLVAGDARRKEVYWARYAYGRPLTEPSVSKAADLLPLESGAMAGAGARQYAEILQLPLLDSDFPTVRGLALVLADRLLSGAPSDVLTPLYLRRPDAVPTADRKPVTQ